MSPVVSELWIYPVKGLRGYRLEESLVERRGLRYDRRWMAIDAFGRFVSQRELPAMATLSAVVTNGQLVLGDSASEIAVPSRDLPVMATVWSHTVKSYDCGQAVATWLSDRLDQPLRLVEMKADSVRPVGADGEVSYADGYPILIVGQESLDDLNARLPIPIPMNRFRPNIVTKGLPAFGEDDLREFAIGEASFKWGRRCARCLVTTTDQETGERLGPEPIATLSGYRLIDGKAMFGSNLLPTKEGVVRVGDVLQVAVAA
jgi:uncharacterized protein YcbX